MGDTAEKKPEELNDNPESLQSDGSTEEKEVDFIIDGEEEETPTSESVPLAKHIDLKKKLRGHKQQAKTAEEENKALAEKLAATEQENQLLKLSQQQKKDALEFPDRKNFADEFGDLDDEAYDMAVKDYHAKVQSKIDEASQAGKKTFEEYQAGEIKTREQQAYEDRLEKVLIDTVEKADSLGVKNFDQHVTELSGKLPDGAVEGLLADGLLDVPTIVFLNKNDSKLQAILQK